MRIFDDTAHYDSLLVDFRKKQLSFNIGNLIIKILEIAREDGIEVDEDHLAYVLLNSDADAFFDRNLTDFGEEELLQLLLDKVKVGIKDEKKKGKVDIPSYAREALESMHSSPELG